MSTPLPSAVRIATRSLRLSTLRPVSQRCFSGTGMGGYNDGASNPVYGQLVPMVVSTTGRIVYPSSCG